ncbi:membrane protein insertase YidC [Candidatus Nucleicultrix amoebiphila]|jgi:YidC/Oxa1 family membrane protein insertase|uniref:Membrane protein insertase YidC n=1 Tax=Candidatus Nucleicultrix amoebiphila FS5 TaxID=1414854 RepID=A0A1W6N605_9PROT|nr:membrane protein insertase YidC [Candidatus Nucleicultrix amoebiphila]ARN85212.1 hypothetical protein GQ61_07855 [Candidatus Nucleicultrix amoebiphila FS5]
MDQKNNLNLLFVLILTTIFFIGWNYFYERPRDKKLQETSVQQTTSTQNANAPMTNGPTTQPVLSGPVSVDQAIKSDPRITIETPKLKGSINLTGARFDNLSLEEYRENGTSNSPTIALLNPQNTQNPYFAEFGWVSDQQGQKLPDMSTLWQADQKILKINQPVTLHWNNGQGLIFERVIKVDDQYLFTITDRVTNKTNNSLNLSSYGIINRFGTPKTSGFMILHEGPLGYLNDKLIEIDYKDLQKKPLDSYQSEGGWMGITDKYWLTALIPDQKMQARVNYKNTPVTQDPSGASDHYSVDYLSPAQVVKTGESIEATTHLFAGAKVLEVLDQYEVTLGIKHFDKAVDFGRLYFLTKPIFYALTFFNGWLGNLGLAIIFLTILIRIALFPLANKSFRSMARMKKVQPQLTRIRELYENDKVRMNQEMMALYKKEKVNPLAGCLPMLVQIPVFFSIYKVLYISIEMRHAPFYGWIHDLSAPDPTSLFNLFGLISWAPPSYLMIGVWPLLMGGTMFLQQKLSPPPADPAQAKIFMLMPFMFTVMLAQFPAGLVIYWTWTNLLSIIQQWSLMKLDERKSKNK